MFKNSPFHLSLRQHFEKMLKRFKLCVAEYRLSNFLIYNFSDFFSPKEDLCFKADELSVSLQLVSMTVCDKEEIPLQIGVIPQTRVLDHFHELYVCSRIKCYTKM